MQHRETPSLPKKEKKSQASVAQASKLLLRRQRSGGSRFKPSSGKSFMRPYLEKTLHRKGLVEWVMV
jgi:hypothetical protein